MSEENPRTLSEEEKEELGIKTRNYTQERKDRVLPAIAKTFAAIGSFDFKRNYKAVDNQKKSDTEHQQYQKFVAKDVKQIMFDHDFRKGDVGYYAQLLSTCSNLLQEVTYETKFNERVIAAAEEIMAELGNEEQLTPTETKQNKTEAIKKAENRLIKLQKEVDALAEEYKTEKISKEEFTEQKFQLHKRQEALVNYLNDLEHKESHGYVVFRDIMHRVIEPAFEKHGIKFYEASSVFAVISHTIENITRVLVSIVDSIEKDSTAKLWGVDSVKDDLKVENMVEVLEKKE